MACPGERMEHERKVLELLRGPVEIGYRDGTTMTMRRDNSYVTLRRR